MDALKQARERLAARIRDPRAKAFGIDSDLRAISAALDALEQCCDQLAAANVIALAKLYGVNGVSKMVGVPDVFVELHQFGPRARDAIRRVTHGERCHCEECM